MKTITKRSLDELAKEMPVLSEMDLRGMVGGTGVFTEEEFWSMYLTNKWEGGQVEGWGTLEKSYNSVSMISGEIYIDGKNKDGELAPDFLEDEDTGFQDDPFATDSGFSGDSGIVDDEKTPFTFEEFERMLNEGSWNGGYVEGLGLVGTSMTYTGSRMNTFDGLGGDYMLAEGHGITSSLHYRGYYNFTDNGDMTVSTELVTPAHVGSDYTYSAKVQVFHNGKLYGEYKLDIPSNGIIYQTGNVPLGHVSFTLPKDGKVTVRLLIGTVYDSGVGNVPGLIEKDIYVR